MRKKIITMALAMMMAVSISACGGNEKNTTADTEAVTTESTTEATTETTTESTTESTTEAEKDKEKDKDKAQADKDSSKGSTEASKDEEKDQSTASSTTEKKEDTTKPATGTGTSSNTKPSTGDTNSSSGNKGTSSSDKNTSNSDKNKGDSNKNDKPSKPAKPSKPNKPSKPEKPTETPKEEVTLTEIVDAVKKVYGDSYYPNMAIEADVLAEQYGITKDMYEEVIAEGPMLSFQIDTFIAVKAKDGKVNAVKKAMENYKNYLVEESMQYPMNAAKLPAIQIYNFDNYVFFSMLVTPPEETAETEEEILEAAKAHNQIAYDTIAKFFK